MSQDYRLGFETALETENCSLALVLGLGLEEFDHGLGLGLGIALLVLADCKSSGVLVNQENRPAPVTA